MVTVIFFDAAGAARDNAYGYCITLPIEAPDLSFLKTLILPMGVPVLSSLQMLTPVAATLTVWSVAIVVFHPFRPKPVKLLVDVGLVYADSVTVSGCCSVLYIVKKTVEVLLVDELPSLEVASALSTGIAIGYAGPLDVAEPLETDEPPGMGSTTTVVVPVTNESDAGGDLSANQRVVPLSTEK